MIECSFVLNDEPMSIFDIGVLSVPAFSGMGAYANRRMAMCNWKTGPIPVGAYYIFDRQSGGRFSRISEMLGVGSDKKEWFSLYAIDGNIDDDRVICDEIIRGQFRLHPKGPRGISEGCITIDSHFDWIKVRTFLKASPQVSVGGSSFKAYGKVIVR